MLLERVVAPHGAPLVPLEEASMEFDASPWGGGGILRLDGKPAEYFFIHWSAYTAAHLGVVPGSSDWQSFWELLALLVCLILWGPRFAGRSVAVLGDNTAALTDALNLKGHGSMISLAKEISWRQARGDWRFRVGHLPAEHNLLADALSRLVAPDSVAYPHHALSGAKRISPPDSVVFVEGFAA